MPRLYALVLSGGAGTRLWPRSRRARPKQFLDLVGESSLLQDTVERVSDLIPTERVFLVAPPEHRSLIHEQLPGLAADHVVVEPYPRGNAAAVALAMASLQALDPDAVVVVLPSDHVIRDRRAFRDVLLSAAAAADVGYIVTLGIEPEGPDTGFGYIEAGAPLAVAGPIPVRAVKRFIEKPGREAALRMVGAGGYYWNAGMFVWRVSVVLEAYREHLPHTAKAIEALTEALGSPRYEQVLADAWEETDRTTIDYGIAEKAANVAVVPAVIGWHDVGSWARLAEVAPVGTTGGVIARDAERNFVHAPGKLVTLIGVSDLVVVDTPDALLVSARDRAEDVKAVVDGLEREGRQELL